MKKEIREISHPALKPSIYNQLTVPLGDNRKIRSSDATPFPMGSGRYLNIFSKISSLNRLKPDWDSYGADKISMTAIDRAHETLRELFNQDFFSEEIMVNVFPMRDGGIQFEFDDDRLSAELEINPEGDTTYILYNKDGNILYKTKIFELSEVLNLLNDEQYA